MLVKRESTSRLHMKESELLQGAYSDLVKKVVRLTIKQALQNNQEHLERKRKPQPFYARTNIILYFSQSFIRFIAKNMFCQYHL